MLCLSAIMISGCGEKAVKKEKMSDAEICNKIQAIIDDHPNKFSKFKKHMVIHKRHTSWTAEKILPSARECQVWEWSTGLTNYHCEWKADDENKAIANYQEANDIIQNCLGPSWTAETNSTVSGGRRTMYSKSNTPTAVSIRYFKETTGWVKGWYNNILIGDRSNLNTPVQ